jgi:para-nitrobenzyl esterase
LFLNVFTPDTARDGDKLPVLVYIHGGSFTGGCGHEKHFDGPVWPAKGVIGVTLNYRLGPLGFACLPELKQEAGITGNYGLFDQMTAIRWVRDNIASFGGDPENITIMGQSAGAMSVQQHCLSPLTDGLFQKAVMSSGGGGSKLMAAQAPEKSYDFWHAVMDATGCKTLEQFRALPVEQLFATWQNLKKSVKGGNCSPCLDGKFVVGAGADLLKAGKQKKIPYMVGSTSEDVMPPILYQMAKNWCAAQEKGSYGWFFDRQLPGDNKGAWHSSDLWYWFGTLDNCWRPMTNKDRQISDQMTDYLTNFCKYGDPNGSGLTAWLPMARGQEKVLRIGEGDTRMGKADMIKLIKTLVTNSAVGE